MAEDDEGVMSTIPSNTRAGDALTVEHFNDVRTRLHDLGNDHGRRLERIENIIKAMVYFIIFSRALLHAPNFWPPNPPNAQSNVVLGMFFFLPCSDFSGD